jgi:hypothetical protein
VSLNSGVNAVEEGEEVAVSFARAEVVPQLLDQSPNVDILFYIFDHRGAAVAFKAKRINFNDAARVTTGYLTLREPFALPAGRYTAKVLLQIIGTRSMGLSAANLRSTRNTRSLRGGLVLANLLAEPWATYAAGRAGLRSLRGGTVLAKLLGEPWATYAAGRAGLESDPRLGSRGSGTPRLVTHRS